MGGLAWVEKYGGRAWVDEHGWTSMGGRAWVDEYRRADEHWRTKKILRSTLTWDEFSVPVFSQSIGIQ